MRSKDLRKGARGKEYERGCRPIGSLHAGYREGAKVGSGVREVKKTRAHQRASYSCLQPDFVPLDHK
jgi:hypothetical protein